MLTTKSITTRQLSVMRSEAYQAGDYVQGAICDLAIYGSFDADDYTCLDDCESRRVARMTQDDALAECVRVINAAQAQRAGHAVEEV